VLARGQAGAMLEFGAAVRRWRWVAATLAALLALAWLAPFFFEIALVPTASMAGTIIPGDHLFVQRHSGARVAHGDIVSFRAPGREFIFIKRVVAVAGDTVEIRSGEVWLNGQRLVERYKTTGSRTGSFGPVVVPAGRIFVLGDNRDLSEDSRAFGAVPLGDVTGRPLFICWSFALPWQQWLDARGDLRLTAYVSALGHVRWERIAKRL
jgi:signal peptidase I